MTKHVSRRQVLGGVAGLSAALPIAAIARPIRITPINAPQLSKIPAMLQPFIDRGDLSGIVALTAKDGKVIQAVTLGLRDIESRAPMRRNTLFRIASMTKPIVSAAAMMLIEEQKLSLGDAVTNWLPELADLKVLRNASGSLEDIVPARRDITVEDLLTHRAGLAYGFASNGPIAKAYIETLGDPRHPYLAPDAWLKALGSLPLSYQPGHRMHYSHATDVLGILLSRLEGKSLGSLLEQRIFGPLGMRDTGFFVTRCRWDRLASLYSFGEERGTLVKVNDKIPERPPNFEAGGSGLFATADDYLAFAQMLLNGGHFAGKQLLRPSSVQTMATNRLTIAQRQIPFIGRPVWTGMGFGLGLGIVDDPLNSMLGYGSRGAYSWPGAYGTWWQADPSQNLAMIYMIQHAIPLTSDSGAAIAGGRDVAGRGALPVYQKLTYDALRPSPASSLPQA